MGYFGFGWARSYRVGPDGLNERVRVVARDANGKLFCVVTPSSISLWSAGRHRVVVGAKRWSDDTDLVGACFNASGRRLLVTSSSGRTKSLALEVPDPADSVTSLSVRGDHLAVDHGDESLPRVLIHERDEQELNLEPATMCRTSRGGLIGCANGDVALVTFDLIVEYHFNLQDGLLAGDSLQQIGAFQSAGEVKQPLLQDKRIRALDFCETRSLLGCVTQSGVAVLLTASKQHKPNPRKGWWLRTTKAASIALEERRGIAAVGLENGDVEMYLVGYSPGERCPLLRRLSLSSWYFVPDEIGSASLLRWSNDGSALATGWEKQGLVVWSASGCRLVWTLPQVGSAVASTPVSSARGGRGADPLGTGVVALEWGAQGYSLLGVPKRNRNHEFVEYQLFKSAVLDNPFQSEATRLAMIGSDRIMVLGLSDESGEDVFDWQQLLYQREYMLANWPPRLVAVNAELTYLAVAGRRGFAICHVRSRRWRVFGDVRQEQSVRCCAIAWVDRLVCACCETQSGLFKVRLYPRDHLDESSIAASHELSGRVLSIDVRMDGHVLILCAEGSLVLLKVDDERANRGGVKLTQVFEVVLQRGLAEEVSAARIYPPLSVHSKSSERHRTPTKVVLLKRMGNLLLLDMVSMVSTLLAGNVEQFWYTSSTEVPFDRSLHRPLWWAHSDEGLLVSFGRSSGGGITATATTTERWFDWDPEVYPLGLSPVHGMVLGVTQGLIFETVPKECSSSMRTMSQCHVFTVKRQPVLHRLLRHALMNNSDDRVALQLALRCVNLPQFEDSLEWLLYETVLEQDTHDVDTPDFDANAREGLFRRVVRLLRYFGEYEDIVVRCARKMDSHWWPLLFVYAGEPASLLETCSHTGRLRTAACLLVTLQEMFGYMSSTPHALRLLDASLATGQLELAADLSNFLRKAHQANMLSSVQMHVRQDVGRLVEELVAQDGSLDPSERPLFIVVASVISRATVLLEEMNLRALGALSRAMSFPLHLWLAKTRDRKATIENLPKSLHLLHKQFEWPLPLEETVEIRVQCLLKVRNGQVVAINGSSQGALGGRTRRYQEEIRKEIVFMQKACLKACSYDLAVLTSTLLLDIEALWAILTTTTSLQRPTLDGLSRMPSPGYNRLAEALGQMIDK